MPTFVLTDETKMTAHGFMLMTSGGRLERFKENPVMLDSHDESKVIGKWTNLRTEGNRLVADTEFDKEDPEAMKLQGKVERGYIRGASMGIQINDAEMLDMPGIGKVPVLTDWELLEASLVAVPSNAGSLRLYANDGKTLLKAEEIKLSIASIINQKQTMEKITLSAESCKALGIGKEPELVELNAAIMELSAKNTALEAAKAIAEKALSDHRAALAAELVDTAIKEGRLTADRKESFVKLATTDYKQAQDIIASLPAKQTFSDKTRTGGKAPADREGWDYMRWLKEDSKGLSALQKNDPEAFATLKAGYKSVN